MIAWLFMIVKACDQGICVEKVHDFWCATEGCTATMSFESLQLCAPEFEIQVGGTAATFYDNGIERYNWTHGRGTPWLLSVTHHVADLGEQFNHSTSIKSADGVTSLLEYNGISYLVYGRITYSMIATKAPTPTPTHTPTTSPTEAPTTTPTQYPTSTPTTSPTGVPTVTPTQVPTSSPTTSPTGAPTLSPTQFPTGAPTVTPTQLPTSSPTTSPTDAPTLSPTQFPTGAPTVTPTQYPTSSPTNLPTELPSNIPTHSPSASPTWSPTTMPTDASSELPTHSPTAIPTESPSNFPTATPTSDPTFSPTSHPTLRPSARPTLRPSPRPTRRPTPAGIGGANDWSYCHSGRKCSLGQGDCDNDSDCAAGLTCGTDNCRSFHPTALPTTDCCYDKAGIGATDDMSYCSSSRRCLEGQGDCDTDSDCATGLTCGKDNCRSFHPNASPTADCCYDKPGIGAADDGSYCSSSRRCSEGQGDCDSDSDCATGLTCGRDNCRSFHPNAAPAADCCYDKPGIGAADDGSYCSSSRRCSNGQGDCDSDSDCASGLTCGTNNCRSFHLNASPTADCCYDKPGIGASDDWSYCSSSRRCSEGQGDCDSDSDCASGLVCGTDNCKHFNSASGSDCCARKLTVSRSETGWLNDFDQSLVWSAGSNRMVTGLRSYHDNGREGRRWQVKYGSASGVSCSLKGWSKWQNDFDNSLSFTCPSQQVLNGFHSYHSNSREDRRWEFRCCVVSGAQLKNEAWTGYLNSWDNGLDYRCASTKVMNGVYSYHDNHREDRRWKVKCVDLVKA